mgnify:CR=1 FL=1
MIDERTLLIEALTKADGLNPETVSLLGGPSDEFTKIMTEAMAKCPSFQSIKGGVIHCPSVTVANIGEDEFMSRFSIRPLVKPDPALEVDWLLKTWRTRKTHGYHIAAIWGLSLPSAIRLNETDTLQPFSEVPDCPFKRTIINRAKRTDSLVPWQSNAEWQEPTAALVRVIPDWVYIQENPIPDAVQWFPTLDDIDFFAMLTIQIGAPIVTGSGSALSDESLDLYSHHHAIYWEHPEVAPIIERVTELDPTLFINQREAFQTLPKKWRQRLLRAAARFSLSQCRQEPVDKVLDLALAYEIVLSSDETNAGISWKLAVRAAQIIGGDIDKRIAIRDQVNAFYGVRSRASHGGDIKPSEDVVEHAADTFRRLFVRLVELRAEPNWKKIELEALPANRP